MRPSLHGHGRASTVPTSTSTSSARSASRRSSPCPSAARAAPSARSSSSAQTRAFEDRDVELLSVLGGLVAAGVRHAELIDEAREKRRPEARRRGYAEGDAHRAPRRRRSRARRRRGAPATTLAPERATPRGSAWRSGTPTPTSACSAGAFDVADKAIRGLAERARATSASARTRASWAPTWRSSRTSRSPRARDRARRDRGGGRRGRSPRWRATSPAPPSLHARPVPRGARARHRRPLRRADDARRERQARGAAQQGAARGRHPHRVRPPRQRPVSARRASP